MNSELFETDGRAHTVTPGAPVGAKNERSSSHYVRYQPYVQQEILFFEFNFEFDEQKGYSIKARF